MCIDTVSPPNVSRYGDISIYCCISDVLSLLSHIHKNICTYVYTHNMYGINICSNV